MVDDGQLVEKARQGDQSAFAELVTGYRSYVYTIAWKITLNEDDALDVTQEVFMRVAQKMSTLRLTGSFQGWLGSIAARQAISHCRKPARREIATDPWELASAVNAGAVRSQQTTKVVDAQWQKQLVQGAMADLSPQQRAILTLILKEDMQPHEVAQQLGLGASQVRSQLHRAIAALRERLATKASEGKRGKQ